MPKQSSTRTHQAKEASRFRRLWDALALDVSATGADAREFPLTDMSRALAQEIWRLPPAGSRQDCSAAVDVGTGTGVHAILMAARGYAPVYAIDANVDATRLAASRARRLLAPHHAQHITFIPESLDTSEHTAITAVSLATFNPPSFYDFGEADTNTPAFTGVYVDHGWRHFLEPERSFVYRFFRHVVLPRLAIGGHAILTWPGIERRLVEDMGMGTGAAQPVSPAILLRHWFDVDVSGSSLNSREFFSRRAMIRSDYGLGHAFWANLYMGATRGVYSRLVDMQSQPVVFPYGLLHLVRRSPTAFVALPASETMPNA